VEKFLVGERRLRRGLEWSVLLRAVWSGDGGRQGLWCSASAAVLLSHGLLRALCAMGAAYVVFGAAGRDAADVERREAAWVSVRRAASSLTGCGFVFFACHGAGFGALWFVFAAGCAVASCAVLRDVAALG
jgi:hypothetical protein